MSEQERLQALFELCGTHVMNQGERCMFVDPITGNENGCCYFGKMTTDEDGETRQLMCGAAPILDPIAFKAHPKFKLLNEEQIAEIHDQYNELVKPEWQCLNDKEFTLLDKMQTYVHDEPAMGDCRPVFRARLEDLAQEFDLNTFFLKNWDD